ncbi:MAG: hypothetical protein OHK0037_00360 [Elainellaceae cyanobacterium]
MMATLYIGGLRAAIQSFLAGGWAAGSGWGLAADPALSIGSREFRCVAGGCRVGLVVIAGE